VLWGYCEGTLHVGGMYVERGGVRFETNGVREERLAWVWGSMHNMHLSSCIASIRRLLWPSYSVLSVPLSYGEHGVVSIGEHWWPLESLGGIGAYCHGGLE
jgi:hypothetical protein